MAKRLLDLYRAERAFHQINLEQQNMRLLHARPYIFAVDDFLSPDECKLLIEKAESASLKKQDFERAPGRARTSFGCIARNEEVSGLRHRIAHLARVELSQLQPLKLTRYEAGQVPVRPSAAPPPTATGIPTAGYRNSTCTRTRTEASNWAPSRIRRTGGATVAAERVEYQVRSADRSPALVPSGCPRLVSVHSIGRKSCRRAIPRLQPLHHRLHVPQ